MEQSRELAEKKELILASYSLAFDREMAYAKVSLTKDERELLKDDEEFQSRLANVLINQREKLIRQLNSLSNSVDEQISLKATLELGKILYPTGFSRTGDDDPEKSKKDTEYNTPEEDARIKAEYEYLLHGSRKAPTNNGEF
jgi:hypothetical protein